MAALPFLLERVLDCAARHHELLGVSLLQLLALRTLLAGDLGWGVSWRFPFPTQHFRWLPFEVYQCEIFAAIIVGEVIVGASDVGRRVYIFGPQADSLTHIVAPGILHSEPL